MLDLLEGYVCFAIEVCWELGGPEDGHAEAVLVVPDPLRG